MFTFLPISQFQRGILSNLIYSSYVDLVEQDPIWESEKESWDVFDTDAFDNLDTVGQCIFVSVLNDVPIGLGSFDPRPGPEVGIVGQNCILPEYRGCGYGKVQLLEILKRFDAWKYQCAKVTTSEHPFFLPAQKMYQSVGFRETRRFPGGPDARYKIVEFEKYL